MFLWSKTRLYAIDACVAVTVLVIVLYTRKRRLDENAFNVVHHSHSRFHNVHNFILPMAIFVFFFSVCVAADVDAEVSIGGDNDDDGGDYYYDDFASHVDDDDGDDDDKI
ncbi:hypothetical protein ElyMa_003399900 [Elysia marginata]|uniref:Uncharacterized protein n=1 Tax=Elysia marginata TaxID=1093978 RepID=A0AAV4JR27_9GAST|nr:hypothetical protein ElyMa_003399900 [Elysia marginata]